MKPDLFDHYDEYDTPPPGKPSWAAIIIVAASLGSLAWWLIP